MLGLFRANEGCIGRQHEMDARIGHQVGLEFGNIHIESSIESETGGQGRDNLRNETIQVGVGGALNAQIAAADVVL